jgi:hypothetical protein
LLFNLKKSTLFHANLQIQRFDDRPWSSAPHDRSEAA